MFNMVIMTKKITRSMNMMYTIILRANVEFEQYLVSLVPYIID